MADLIKNKWLPFKEAREYLKTTSIKTQMEWKYKRKHLPSFIPRDPHLFYKEEWRGFSDWLGTNNIRGRLRKYQVNDNYFKRWSNDMAYILGFWWADGYIRIRKRNGRCKYGFGICQKTADKYILQDILVKMESNNPICTPSSRPCMSHFEIISESIYKDIVGLGGMPNKSLISRLPQVPMIYVKDFIRGCFDGDGSISLNKKNNKTPNSYICSGSIEFVKEIKVLLSGFGVYGKIDNNGNKNGTNGPCYLFRMGASDSRKLGELMYYDRGIIKLYRKYEKFKQCGAIIQ